MPPAVRKLRRRCAAVLDELRLPQPFSLDTLCPHIAGLRGRPLHLHPLPAQAASAGACGLWLATATDDHVFVEQRTVRLHQEHIVLHEIGHMLLGHQGLSLSGRLPETLLPDLSPRLVRHLLARADYSTEQEQEAEMLASMIRTDTGRTRPPVPTGALGRLRAAFGVRDGGHGG
ncbi:hypothetical protein [Kitasatospora purpeofusca]|uniref:hypothetical protein n=1 Tax=Kitasatospora purpeofusca TaxID=67352 RepID=UPI0037F1197D